MSFRPPSFLLFVFAALPSQAADSKACGDLVSYRLAGGAITKAELVQSGSTSGESSVPPFCRVAATLKPSADSDIRMQLWLPEDWNGKLEGNGNGGWTGSINPSALSAGVRRGYASAMSDLGHEGSRATFAMGHPEKLVDFGYRGAHEMTAAWATVPIAAPSQYTASLGSMQNFRGYLGGALAPTVTGFIVQRTGSFSQALMLSAAVSLCSAAAYLLFVGQPIQADEAQ